VEASASQVERLRDFAQRTHANLGFIDRYVAQHQPTDEVYEVTQLLNSLLWLVVVADEWLVLHELVPIDALYREGLTTLRLTGDEIPTDIASLTHFLRNAVSHVNVEVVSDLGRITEVRLWNHLYGKITAPHKTDLVISVTDLRLLAELLPRRYGLLEPASGPLILRPDRL
jgi:hypothetical protein